jgi:phosphohistidine swiveling domain-containing protein
MSELEFISIVTRYESPLWVSLVCTGGARAYYQEALGWAYSIDNYRYEAATHKISVPDAVRMQEIISSELRDGFYERYLARCIAVSDSVVARAREVEKAAPSLPDEVGALFEAFDAVLTQSLRAMPFLASLVLIQGRLEADLKEMLAAELQVDPSSDRVAEYLRRAVVPTREANFVLEARALRRLATQLPRSVSAAAVLTDPATRELVEAHRAEFGWLGTFTFLHDPFTAASIAERATLARDIGGEDATTAAIERSASALAESNELIAAVRDDRLQQLLSLARDYLYWRFERIDVHFQAEVRTRGVQERLAALAGISRTLLMMCTHRELVGWASTGEGLPPKAELAEREAVGIDYFVDTGVHSVRLAKPVLHVVDEQQRAIAASDGIRGTTAWPGQVEGTVRLVRSVADVDKVDVGDVLVTTMTTPDLILALERAGAIVTDEGGLLCHAAIISRELATPCLIGCETATVAFADGDRVAVDAGAAGGRVRLQA